MKNTKTTTVQYFMEGDGQSVITLSTWTQWPTQNPTFNPVGPARDPVRCSTQQHNRGPTLINHHDTRECRHSKAMAPPVNRIKIDGQRNFRQGITTNLRPRQLCSLGVASYYKVADSLPTHNTETQHNTVIH